MDKNEIRILAAIQHTPTAGFVFSHRYEKDAPYGKASLWAMSDGTVRWKLPDEED